MFGFKRREKVDKDQLELIKNAQSRIRQKKALLSFYSFNLGCSCLFVVNKFIGLGKQFTFLEKTGMYLLLHYGLHFLHIM